MTPHRMAHKVTNMISIKGPENMKNIEDQSESTKVQCRVLEGWENCHSISIYISSHIIILAVMMQGSTHDYTVHADPFFPHKN